MDGRRIPLALLLRKWLFPLCWRPVEAMVQRIESRSPDRQGHLILRVYQLPLSFDWKGQFWYRSRTFPRTYHLPQEGGTLHLLYNQKEEQCCL